MKVGANRSNSQPLAPIEPAAGDRNAKTQKARKFRCNFNYLYSWRSHDSDDYPINDQIAAPIGFPTGACDSRCHQPLPSTDLYWLADLAVAVESWNSLYSVPAPRLQF